jgi:hypothetical protein
MVNLGEILKFGLFSMISLWSKGKDVGWKKPFRRLGRRMTDDMRKKK